MPAANRNPAALIDFSSSGYIAAMMISTSRDARLPLIQMP